MSPASSPRKKTRPAPSKTASANGSSGSVERGAKSAISAEGSGKSSAKGSAESANSAKRSLKSATKPAPAEPFPPAESIHVRGARVHNLRSVDVDIPAGAMTVVTGVSGSGKSSLAFDTLFAEGQRRFVESLSTYARQFIARMPRPDVDRIDHIPPAIALEQKNSVRNARSTVGTATEINDFLRLIFAKAGRIISPETGAEVRRHTVRSVVEAAFAWEEGTRFLVLAPVALEDPSRAEAVLREVKRQGFTRIVAEGEAADLDDPAWSPPGELAAFEVVVDRLAVRESSRSRAAEAVQAAFHMGRGTVVLRTTEGTEQRFNADLVDEATGRRFRDPEPRLFSFANPLGACPSCQGFGRVTGLDWDRILPDHSLSISDGAIAPWRGEAGLEMIDYLQSMNDKLKVHMHKPWRDLAERQQRIVRDGQGDWPGIRGYFEWLEGKRYKVQARIQIARYRGYTECPACGGARLVDDALCVRVGGLNIAQVCAMSVAELHAWLEGLELPREDAQAVERPLREVKARVDYLLRVGLGYLTLSRQTRTLSGGEAQRINLATALGSALTETLYVLDEPTVGLHPRDTDRLVGILESLTGLGNTVVVVEHDLDVIRRAERLVDIGPGAGERGGEVLFQGPPAELAAMEDTRSKTARFLRAESGGARALPGWARRKPRQWITVRGARENNLRDLTVRFPLGVLCAVTGVSGSGKSTLVAQCLHGNWRRDRGDGEADAGHIAALEGAEAVEDIVLVDQEPIGRSSRSNAATYLKAYDGIRKLMASTAQAERAGLSPRDFSFNVEGGRCEACQGTGVQVIDMQFLADVEVVCDQCDGRRFQERVLAARWKGRNIDDILKLTVDEAAEFFHGHKAILKGLDPLREVGLGYLRLGQATSTLSGGEAQRLKLAAHLAEASRKSGPVLLVFDEPTTGLHAADLEILLGVFDKALDLGFSLLVIEHNLELIRRADWIIDLGPEGGPDGGRVVAEGPPEEIAARSASITGRFLKA